MSFKGLVQDLSGAAASPTRVLMLACGAAGAILFIAAWIGLMAELAPRVVALGISLDAALTAVAFADLAAALALLWLCAPEPRPRVSGDRASALRPKRLELV